MFKHILVSAAAALALTLGTLGVTYHLTNGLSTFAVGWGLVGSRRALQKLELVGWLAFAVLLLVVTMVAAGVRGRTRAPAPRLAPAEPTEVAAPPAPASPPSRKQSGEAGANRRTQNQ